jgi:hypothetical protein
MVANQMPASLNRTDNVRTLADKSSDHKKGGSNLIFIQYFKQLLRVRIVGAVIEGQSDLTGIAARNQGTAKDLRTGRERGVDTGS